MFLLNVQEDYKDGQSEVSRISSTKFESVVNDISFLSLKLCYYKRLIILNSAVFN